MRVNEEHNYPLDDSDDGSVSVTDTDATSECDHSVVDTHECACHTGDDDAADFLDTEGQIGVAVETIMFLTVSLYTRHDHKI